MSQLSINIPDYSGKVMIDCRCRQIAITPELADSFWVVFDEEDALRPSTSSFRNVAAAVASPKTSS
jgi:hypothetical protein